MAFHKLDPNFRFGPKDPRDYKFGHRLKMMALKIPDLINLDPVCPPPFDQAQEGSCAGNSTAEAIDFLQLREMRLLMPKKLAFSSKFEPVSRNFLYFCGRKSESDQGQDSGIANLRDICQVATNIGACRESVWPYSDKTLYATPSAAAYAEASAHKVPAYFAVEKTEITACLASGFPCIMGFNVPTAFQDETMATTGMMSESDWSGSIEGGHAVMIIGFDKKTDLYRIRNSWGKDWGVNGDFFMPKDVMKSDLTNDQFSLQA